MAKQTKEVKMDMAIDNETKRMVKFKETESERPIALYLRKEQVAELGDDIEDIEVIVRKKV